MLVSDLLAATGQTLGLIAAGETLASQDSTLLLATTNALIDSWNAAVLKGLNGNYAALIAQFNAGVQKSLAEGYDPSFYTFNALSTATPLFTFHAVSDFVNLTDAITLPNGWPRALQFNAAIEAAPAYGVQVSQELAASAQDAKAAILSPPNFVPSFSLPVETVLGRGIAQPQQQQMGGLRLA